MASGPARPPVSVVVPFLGDREEALLLAETLEAVELRPDDEVIVADNTEPGTFAEAVRRKRIAVVRSTGEHSSYHSRNVGANAARNDWLLFLDADCRPRADIADRYFDEPIPDAIGALAGAVPPLRRGDGRMARYEESRSGDKQALHIANSYKPFGVTANLLVRRAAWERVGGFQEGVRSGGDADFCWRIQDAGWELAYCGGAEARHLLRESLRAYLRLHARYGAGRRWLHLRHPPAPLGPRPRSVLRNAAGAVLLPFAGRFERGLFKAIDVAVTLTETAGYTLGNAGRVWPREAGGGPKVAVLADRFPKPSETFVLNEARALAELGAEVEVIARSRPERPALGATWELSVRYLEDAGILREVLDLGWLAARHPLRCARDLIARRRWRREEAVAPLRVLAPLVRRLANERFDHVHVHFARRAALDALRARRLLGIPYSVTPHAWDIFRETCNLPEKIERAAFTTSGCDYNVRYLRTLVSPAAGERIHKIVMGIDPVLLERTEPYGGDGTVLAIGRLVEKKGFADLVDAAARLRDFDGLARVVIVGDGPLRGELEERARAQDLDGLVTFAGAKRFDEVRAAIQDAALLAMPAVVAADGDRDSMPVVVKEALAMGVPVVATDEVGLPEVVRDDWGRLVPPHDPDALAAALCDLLSLPRADRVAMGDRGREFVLADFTVAAQTAKLLDLFRKGV